MEGVGKCVVGSRGGQQPSCRVLVKVVGGRGSFIPSSLPTQWYKLDFPTPFCTTPACIQVNVSLEGEHYARTQ